MHLLPLTILVLLGLFGNISNEGNNGLQKEYYNNGAVKTEYSIKTNTTIEATYYYQTGQLREKGCFKGQQMHGMWQSYNESGNLVAEAKYNNGTVIKRTFYNNDGTTAYVMDMNKSDEIIQAQK